MYLNSYEGDNPLLHLAVRIAPEYAAVMTVFKELQTALPDFVPRTIFDFGSGAGTVFWAAREIFGEKNISEMFCVDQSKDQNDLHRLLLQMGKQSGKMIFKDIFYRQYLPVSHHVHYDMVVAAHSLLDQPNEQMRINVIENLWHKTRDMLVIVEHGTTHGFQCVLQARDLILSLGGSEEITEITQPADKSEDDVTRLDDENRQPAAHVVAPCPHDLTCPRHKAQGPVLCNFEVGYWPIDIGQSDWRDKKIMKERFSYVILRKSPRLAEDQLPTWPRFVQPLCKRGKHVICRLCTPDAKIGELRMSKATTERGLYNAVRCSSWGDLLPATLQEIPKKVFDAKKEKLKQKYLARQAARLALEAPQPKNDSNLVPNPVDESLKRMKRKRRRLSIEGTFEDEDSDHQAFK